MEKPSDAQVEQVARAMDVDGVLDWESTDHSHQVAVYAAQARATEALLGFMACTEVLAQAQPAAQPPSTPYPDPAPAATVDAPVSIAMDAPDTPDETAPAAPATDQT
jgi:hypothetical protein